jgi:catechol 2,3-dioxygenase-like lactoylglutathione lyase family enzyme
MRYAHTNIAARNWRALADFYTQVFGCTIKPPQRNLSGEWLDRATGLINARLEGIHLILPGHGPNAPTLEIFTYTDMRTREPLMANHTGLTHIAFEVEDVDTTYAHALTLGATELGRPTEKTIEGVGVLKFVYLRDPEGNIIEIQSWK